MSNLCADRYARLSGLSPSMTLSYSTNNGGAIIAPLFVHCDAIATVSSAVADAFRNLWYKWEVVEGVGGGSWSYGRQAAKSVCYGPIAGFLLPSAGTYTIRLTVFDGYAQKRATDQVITVTSADAHYATTNTIVVNNVADADFTGAPAGATQVNSNDWDATIATYVADNKRVLFKGGSTFDNSTDATITETNVTIGSYGTGRAICRATGNNSGIYPSGSTNLRVLDIEFDGASNTGASAVTTNPASSLTGLTISNCYAHTGGRGYYIHGTGSAGLAQRPDLVGIFGSIADAQVASASGYACFWMGTRVCIIGNKFDSNFVGTGSHTMRMKYGQRFNVSNNDLLNPMLNSGACFKCTAPDRSGAPWDATDDSKSRWGVISDNYLTGHGDSINALVIGPVTNNQDGSCEYIVEERNLYDATTGNGVFVALEGQYLTSRNSIGRFVAETTTLLANINRRGSAPAPSPQDVHLLNWSAYSSLADAAAHTFIYVSAGDGAVVKNNAIYGPAMDGSLTVVSDAGTNTSSGSNSSAAQITGASSPFSSATPSAAADFAAANYALEAGDNTVPVFDDYTGALRYFGNKTPVIDMGAVQTS